MPKAIVLLGPPGSGKGTQGERLAERIGADYIQASELIRSQIRKSRGSEEAEVAERSLRTGRLIPSKLVIKWTKDYLSRYRRSKKDIVLDGVVRTLEQAREIPAFLEKIYGRENIVFIFINIPDKEAVWRNSHRRVCEKCGYPVVYNSRTKNLKKCPVCGGKLIERVDDRNEKLIKFRLEIYHRQSEPVIHYLKNNRNVIEINGDQDVDKVTRDIFKSLSVIKANKEAI